MLSTNGVVSSSTASSPSQGTVRVTINGVNTDVDTGLQTGDSPSFAGLTVDTNTLYIDATNDRVGMGLTNPSTQLHVSSSVAQITLDSSNDSNSWNSGIILKNNPYRGAGLRFESKTTAPKWFAGVPYASSYLNYHIGYDALNSLPEYAASASLTIVGSSGNVGIGTTSPSYKLDVAGTIGLSNFPFAVKSGNYNQIYEPAGNTAIYLGNATDPSNYYDNSTHNWRNRGGGTYYMVLNSSGDLGIGITAQAARIHSYTTTNNKILGIFEQAASSPTATGTPVVRILRPNNTSGAATTSSAALHIVDHSSNVALQISTHTSASILTVSGSGNIGIGTTLPGATLHVQGNISASSFTGSFSGSFTGPGNLSGGTTNYIPLWTSANAQSSSVIYQSSNNIGIGTTSPSAKLDVSGSIFPNADNAFDLGSSTKRWANLYTGDLNLSNEGSSGNNIDGTTGNWTIQEGEEHLFIINNKSGRKFKIVLEEIQ